MSQPTACILVIGNEILSGKTQDANIQFLGFELAKLGIRLEEGRVVRDVPDAIMRHLNECRAKFTYVFTTGGIGPTHDDITAECVAHAFGVALVLERRSRRAPEARRPAAQRGAPEDGARAARLRARREPREQRAGISDRATCSCSRAFRASRARCSRAPCRCSLPASRFIRAAWTCILRESEFAEVLEGIQKQHPEVEIGSYPFNRDGQLRRDARRARHGQNLDRARDRADRYRDAGARRRDEAPGLAPARREHQRNAREQASPTEPLRLHEPDPEHAGDQEGRARAPKMQPRLVWRGRLPAADAPLFGFLGLGAADRAMQ